MVELNRALSPESYDVATCLNDLAETERLSGDFDAAERDYREALRIARDLNFREGIATYTGNLALLALDREDWPDAEVLAREALTLVEKLRHQELIALNCYCLAEALVRQDRKPEAFPHAWRAVEIFAALRSPKLAVARATLAECED